MSVSRDADGLRQAVESGMLTADVRRVAEQVAKDNEVLIRAVKRLEEENRELRAVNAEYRQMELASIAQGMEAEQERRGAPGKGTAAVTAFSCGAMLVMLASVILLLF